MKLPSVMSHNFSEVPNVSLPRSTFNRSHGYKTAFDAGYIIPIYADEVLPGDTKNLQMSAFARLATPIHPIMDNMYVDVHFFFVPNRLTWENWEKLNGEQDNPGDSIDYLVPQVTTPTGGYAAESIYDYLGIPPGIEFNQDINAFHLRAYNLIYKEWYRDENLIDSPTINKDDGPDASTDYALLKRNKRHDYFTSALPWPQKGDAVTLPLGTTADVTGDGNAPTFGFPGVSATNLVTSNTNQTVLYGGGVAGAQYAMNWTDPHLVADLSNATAATINDLREALAIQRVLEKSARGGTRYTEIIKSFFGVTSPDARLQRPELLGMGTYPVSVSAVTQQSETTGSSPQGNLAAIGTMGIRDCGFTKSFTEHGVILGLISARADLTYQQGVERMWSRRDRYDFYLPPLAHLGEQTILNQEIWADGSADDAGTFGYQERWAEYRYKNSYITGKMRSDHANSLDTWHLSQDFATRPALNQTFIEENPPVDRIVAVPTEPDFILDAYYSVKDTRVMPTYSVPGLTDRF